MAYPWAVSPVTRKFLSVLVPLVALYLPFAGKPFHIDDANFLDMARAIEFPFGVQEAYRHHMFGTRNEAFNPFLSTHPPGLPFFLKLAASCLGSYRELPLHLAFLLFPLLLAVGTRELARRVGAPPGPSALAVLGSVAVLPVGHTIMADLPATALWTAGAMALWRGLEERRRGLTLAGGLGIALACLFAYQVVLLTPLLLLVVQPKVAARIDSGKWRPSPAWLVALGASSLAVAALAWWHLGSSGVGTEILRGLRGDRLINKGLSIPVFLGLAFAPLVCGGLTVARRRPWLAGVIALAASSAFLAGFSGSAYSSRERLWLLTLALAGLAGVYGFVRGLREISSRACALFLGAWLGAVLLFNLALLPFGAARYLLPLVPAASVVLLRQFVGARLRAWLAAAAVASVGLLAALVDYQFASSYRDFAQALKPAVGAAPIRVWFIGDWGMRYYMEREGFHYLTAQSNEPQLGDLVVIARAPAVWSPSPSLRPRMFLEDTWEARSWLPFHVMNQGPRAGLYCTLWGFHPLTFSREPLERFSIFRVMR